MSFHPHMDYVPAKFHKSERKLAEPGDDFSFKEVTKLSAKTAGTNHPSPMNLADVSQQKEFPAVGSNDMGHEVFFVKVRTKAGTELPIGLVIKGRTEHE